MSINVEAKNVKLWKNEHEGRKGKWYTFSISASKKMQDGSYKNKSIRVFSKDGIPTEIPNGSVCDINGFLTLDIFQGRDGEVSNIALYANEIKFRDYESQDYGDSFEELDEDVPF
jgi:hypothetical protein